MITSVIDLETCDLAPPAGVCEIGWCDVVQTASGWRVGGGSDTLVNPGQPIPPETSAVHHIVDEDVQDSPTWAEAWDTMVISAGMPDAFCAHNAKFERQWCTDQLTDGRPWVCTYKAALRLWPGSPEHKNQTLRYWRRPEGLNRQVAAVAHRAYPDAYVTAHHLRDMLDLAPFEDLVHWCSAPALPPRCNFGKHMGKDWSEVPSDYLLWMTRAADMDDDKLHTAQHHLDLRAADQGRGF